MDLQIVNSQGNFTRTDETKLTVQAYTRKRLQSPKFLPNCVRLFKGETFTVPLYQGPYSTKIPIRIKMQRKIKDRGNKHKKTRARYNLQINCHTPRRHIFSWRAASRLIRDPPSEKCLAKTPCARVDPLHRPRFRVCFTDPWLAATGGGARRGRRGWDYICRAPNFSKTRRVLEIYVKVILIAEFLPNGLIALRYVWGLHL